MKQVHYRMNNICRIHHNKHLDRPQPQNHWNLTWLENLMSHHCCCLSHLSHQMILLQQDPLLQLPDSVYLKHIDSYFTYYI